MPAAKTDDWCNGFELSGVRIGLLINDLRWYFTHRVGLASAAHAAGAHVFVMAPPSPLAARVDKPGVTFVPAYVRRGLNNIHHEARAVIELRRTYRSLGLDIAHHVTLKNAIYGSVASRMAGVPAVVNTVAGLGSVFIRSDLRTRLLRFGAKSALRSAMAHPNLKVIFQNDDDRQAFVRAGVIDHHRAVLIRGSGVDMTRFSPSPEPEGTPTVALISRMLWDKGIGEFVGAARQLRREGRQYRFILVGAPDPYNPSSIDKVQLRSWEEEGLVEWLGHTDDVPAAISGANVVVLPSYREGLPKVLLEAAASERAVVTFDVPGCRDVVRHGETGLLVPFGDVAGLASSIDSLCMDGPLRRRMGVQGRKLVAELFDERIIVAQTLGVYRDLVVRSRLVRASVGA